tara:strand:- start:16168 stop:16926 length:759 start_codon:yes stop_codon:yes gene_type:complete
MIKTKGEVRVGIKGVSFPGFSEILVLTKSSKYGAIGPYVLVDEKGRIMENIWQFSKVYEDVPKSVQRYSRYDQTIIWDHPAEKHVEVKISTNEDGKRKKDIKLLPSYKNWRKKGMEAEKPIRYPVGMKYRHKCLFALAETEDGKINSRPLNYIESRKVIYVPLYQRLIRNHPMFLKLKKRLNNGENLLIVEIDGPHPESLPYYKQKYEVNDDFIEKGTMLCTQENLNIMLGDEKHPYGHGYALAEELLREYE